MKKEQIISILYDLLEDCKKHLSISDLNNQLILIGGSALSVKEDSKDTNDIDIYIPNKRIKKYIESYLPLFIEEKAKSLGEDFFIDITEENNIWSDLNFPYLKKNNRLETINVNQIEIGIIDSESLLIAKASSSREKDIKDIPVILKHTSIEKTFERFNLLKNNNVSVLENALENIVLTCIEQKIPLEEKIITKLPDFLAEYMEDNYKSIFSILNKNTISNLR